MQVIRGLHNLRDEHRGCVATIGNFDGVHRGHQAILEQCREQARKLQLPVIVVVFEPQPREFFAGDQAPPRLTRLSDKVRLLGDAGVERVLCLPFNDALRSLTAEEFVEKVLIAGLGVRHLVVGDDFRFGCDRRGDFHLLTEVGERRGFGVEHTRTFTLDDERVSSTRVRTLLASGNFDAASRLLGRPYRLGGRVVADQQLGRTIGVPTANLPQPPRPLALQGVYAVVSELPDGRHLPGVANIGWRPTVGSTRPVLEVHLFDFDGDLYGQRLDVFPCAKLRGEVKFDDFEALKRQIHADQARARGFFAERARASGNHDSLPLASAPLARETVTSDSSAGRPADHDDG
ncbi:bifunctional riboflavin kinase/FAD synthetase [Halomonas urumqiensis]|uniref:Riboflavin biosynthesis protein n=1 Tax=Halomonas urumqiensis TaxID=1684789 RepID=A0A2N7UI47_9GAMM|nr:bifunctional riboflavin kinase/FAD synthetase [Halomonas urumqiensis]PMR80116.1 bifunctional riboflavin kinase/FMN adenylyltransferase [Halomonas urumqiensis]PTB01249.1 bifunctional riboflavin kinase/FAD synthetase [Halomonas urumqiensis]GHE22615.1 riboflavin biosynthesis protein [Halomonas urumqiensis]